MVFGLLAPIRGLGQAGFEPNGGTTIGPSRRLGRFQDVKLPGGGWLRIAVRAGLAIGMVGQLAVLWDLKAVIGVAASPSGRWIIATTALSAVPAVLAWVALLVVLLERRSPKATVASGIGCLLAWSYYAATYQWAYFAAQRDGGFFTSFHAVTRPW
jgi:hypothetical protein